MAKDHKLNFKKDDKHMNNNTKNSNEIAQDFNHASIKNADKEKYKEQK